MKCDFCNCSEFERVPGERRAVCSSCELYNAAVDAQKAAATSIATRRHPTAKDAWLNEHGVFAWVGGVTQQVGSPQEAAPFVALTQACRQVATFWSSNGKAA